jgi:hypothetical protein
MGFAVLRHPRPHREYGQCPQNQYNGDYEGHEAQANLYYYPQEYSWGLCFLEDKTPGFSGLKQVIRTKHPVSSNIIEHNEKPGF